MSEFCYFFKSKQPTPSLYGLQHTTTLRSMNICVRVNNLSGTREPCPGAAGESGLHLQSFQTHQPHPTVLPRRGLLKKDGRLERTQSLPGTTQPPLYASFCLDTALRWRNGFWKRNTVTQKKLPTPASPIIKIYFEKTILSILVIIKTPTFTCIGVD